MLPLSNVPLGHLKLGLRRTHPLILRLPAERRQHFWFPLSIQDASGGVIWLESSSRYRLSVLRRFHHRQFSRRRRWLRVRVVLPLAAKEHFHGSLPSPPARRPDS